MVEAAGSKRPELTGAPPPQNAPHVLELILAMYPKTRRIHVVLGASEYERAEAAAGLRLFQHLAGRAQIVYTNALTLEQLDARLAAPPDDEQLPWGAPLRAPAAHAVSTNA